MRVSAALVALTAAVATAQTQNYTSSLDMTIDPGLVEPSDRSVWCRAQSNTCDILCSDNVQANRCDFNDLSYECLCARNESAPGLEFYRETMPFYICQRLRDDCIAQNAGSQDGQEACKTDIGDLCPELAPPALEDVIADEEESETATTSTASQTPTQSSDEEDPEETVTSTESDGFAAPTAAPRAIGALAAIGVVAALI
jgi:hypothetical protein